MKRVVTAFVVFGLVVAGAYSLTEPAVVADERVTVEKGGEAVADITVRNAGTFHVTVEGGRGQGVPKVSLPDSRESSSLTAAVPASGEVEPRVVVEAPKDAEPGEYTVELEAWRLPRRMGESTVTRLRVLVEEPEDGG